MLIIYIVVKIAAQWIKRILLFLRAPHAVLLLNKQVSKKRERTKGIGIRVLTWRDTQSLDRAWSKLFLSGRRRERKWPGTFTISTEAERNDDGGWTADRAGTYITYVEAARRSPCTIYTRLAPSHFNGINLHAPWLDKPRRLRDFRHDASLKEMERKIWQSGFCSKRRPS